MKEKVLVFGHKSPDTDSICSAIAYAELKQKLGINAEAMRLGDISKESEFVLNFFNVETPPLLKTIKPQLKDLRKGISHFINEEDTLKHTIKIMTEKNYSSLPVVDSMGRLENMVSISKIADTYLEMGAIDIFANYDTTFENLLKALDNEAILINGQKPEGFITGNLRGVSELAKIKEGDIVITTLLSLNVENAANAGAALVIICVDESDIIPSFNVDIPVLRVNRGIFKTFKMISQSVPIKSILESKNFYHFEKDDFIDEILDITNDSDQINFPIVDEYGKIFSTINSKHIINIDKNEVILVDHNEYSQSVDGIETAKILEIVDHHKFGNFQTNEPLMIRAEAVGCCSTIIYGLYQEANIIPTKTIAGLMLSAILSDTLIFKSPTSTEKDVNVAKELASIAGLDYNKYGMDMLVAGTSLSDKTYLEIINMDKKEFSMGNFSIAVAQINTVDMNSICDDRDNLIEAINNEIENSNYDLFLFILTDIINNGSKIVAIGEESKLVEQAFKIKLKDNSAWLDGVVSRKKQVIPPLMNASQHR